MESDAFATRGPAVVAVSQIGTFARTSAMLDRSERHAERLAAERPVVVMGRGHSGTRVLAWALEALGLRLGTLEEKATGDAQDRRFTKRIKRLAMRSVPLPATAPPTPRDIRRFRRRTVRFLDWIGDAPQGWGWKFPETYLIGPLVDAVFPQARYVHMVRDGRDLAFKQHLTDDATRGLGHRILEHLGALDEPHYLQAARSWDYQVKRFEDFAATIPDRVHRMTFEELCDDPHATMERLCGFLDMPYNDAAREYLAANIRRGKVAQHREEDPDEVRSVEQLIAPTLVRCGYELTHAADADATSAARER